MSSGSDSSSISTDDSNTPVTVLSAATIIGQQALNMLKTAGDFVPIPGIAVAAGVALSILEIAQTVKSNKEDFITIGKDACVIVTTVIQRVDSKKHEHGYHNNSVLEHDADQLLGDMKIIQKCVKKHAKKRSLMKRVLHHQSDQETIQECRDRIQHALSLFGLQSDIETRQMLAALSSQVTELLHKASQTPSPQMPQPQIPQFPQIPIQSPQHPIQSPQYPIQPPQYPTPYPPFQAQSPPPPPPPPPPIPQPQQSPFPQASSPSPQPEPATPPAPYTSARSEERAERRRKRHEMQMNQLGNAPRPNVPSAFQSAQNFIAPGSSATFHTIHGNHSSVVSDSSIHISGSGNTITFRS